MKIHFTNELSVYTSARQAVQEFDFWPDGTLGCKSAVVAYDADKNVNEHVHRHEKKLVALLKNHSFHTYIGSWNPGFGKGLDDILVLGVKPQVFPV